MQRLAIDFFQTRVLISLANPRYQILLARLMIHILVVHLRNFIIINTKLESMITVITEKKILMKILMFIAINEHENEMVGVMVW